jgi:hypothetical protein
MTVHELQARLPIDLQPYGLGGRTVGLVIVDEVNGFCTVGAGALAPPAPDAQVASMVEETDRLARRFAAEKRAILAFLDTHQPGKPEPPYPPHCERGTGEENLVPQLAWLEDCNGATRPAADRRASQGRDPSHGPVLHGLARRGAGLGSRLSGAAVQATCACWSAPASSAGAGARGSSSMQTGVVREGRPAAT